MDNLFLKEKESQIIENYGYLPKEIEIYEISGPFFFGAAKHYGEVLKGHASVHKGAYYSYALCAFY
jgi:hypothetical protein